MRGGELMYQKEMTSAELKALVDEYTANGGVIAQCPPGVALNFRFGSEAPGATTARKKIAVIKQKRRSSKTKNKKK